ncbi:MAG: SDR family oxidoreductase [Acidobacteria bacterium]|nr:SDR family oxidoreductase [Spirochaetota bacterium]MBE3134031.1 SDR family oxidoreductase [Acidobacteriota bacterium]
MKGVQPMFDLSGKTVVLTGGGGVIAGALAEGFLRAGASVSLWDIDAKAVEQARERAAAAAGKGAVVAGRVVDALSEESVAEAVRATVSSCGGLDVLVNTAGGNRGKSSFLEADIGQFEEVLRLNLVAGLMVPSKAVCRHWIAAGVKGAIINLASMGSYVPLSGVWAYDAAKAGVLNLTMAAAKEFAPHGIRVNAIAPGFFVGKQNKALLIDEATGELTPRGKQVIGRTPFGRFGEARELCGTAVFLACNEASGFVTGVCIPVDGGFLVDCI